MVQMITDEEWKNTGRASKYDEEWGLIGEGEIIFIPGNISSIRSYFYVQAKKRGIPISAHVFTRNGEKGVAIRMK